MVFAIKLIVSSHEEESAKPYNKLIPSDRVPWSGSFEVPDFLLHDI